jgi:hypothetical protein
MSPAPKSMVAAVSLWLGVAWMLWATTVQAQALSVRFTDDFSGGLSKWVLAGGGAVSVHDAGGDHGAVMRLKPDGDVHALIRGSERWGDVAIEGDLLFPEEGDSYLGVIYNFRRRESRTDFGLIYLKFGNRVYLQPNPHRDYNVTRTFYPEYVAPLSGVSGVRVGVWHRFRVEVVGGVAHFFVGDLTRPALIFPIAEPGPGMIGFQPRSVGNEVWVDNVTVRSVAAHSTPSPPAIPAERGQRWEVYGPLASTDDAVARPPRNASGPWRPFALDARGGVETSRVIDYHGPKTVGYFRTRVVADSSGTATLRMSSVDDLAVWVNGSFLGFIGRQAGAWFDFGRNPDHPGEVATIPVVAGTNTIVVRVRGGMYAAGGFFARVERNGAPLPSAGTRRER